MLLLYIQLIHLVNISSDWTWQLFFKHDPRAWRAKVEYCEFVKLASCIIHYRGRCTSKLQMLSQISDRNSGKETSIYQITIFKRYAICYLCLQMHPFYPELFTRSHSSIHSQYTSTGSLNAFIEVLKLSWHILHEASPIRSFRSMRHSTLLSWLQKGQLKTVLSFSCFFFDSGFFAAFLFPIFALKTL